jgi:tetratricopeptide (TPR) repeat protein
VASTCHQLGVIAQEQRDFAAAEQWYRKSLAIREKQGDENGAACAYHNLGKVAEQQEQYEQAGRWVINACKLFRKSDPNYSRLSVNGFLVVYKQADESTRKKLKTMWEQAGLGELPEA